MKILKLTIKDNESIFVNFKNVLYFGQMKNGVGSYLVMKDTDIQVKESAETICKRLEQLK